MLIILYNMTNYKAVYQSLCYQAKRKQALLESNLSGIHLMSDEKVKTKELSIDGSFDIF